MTKGNFPIYGKVPKKLWKTGVYFIGKIQKPIFGTPNVLIYDETRDWELMMPYTEKEYKIVFKGQLKAYWEMCFKPDGEIYLNRQVSGFDF